MRTLKTEQTAHGFWQRLKRAREKWVLIAFAASALVWMEGTVREYVELPARLHHQAEALDTLKADISRLERQAERGRCFPYIGQNTAMRGLGTAL
ncbi:MAG: hypothetical protein AAFR17_06845 [Pseudomonadota bacterium]